MLGLFGTIDNPTQYASTQGQGLIKFASNLFYLVGTIAGVYLIIQIINAGYLYLNASGDVKKTEQAWNKIWQSVLGIVVIACAFIIAGLVEKVTGIKILNPEIYGP